MARPMPNFVILNGGFPDVGRPVAAMLKARQAVESRSWSHPQEPVTEEWWADAVAIFAPASAIHLRQRRAGAHRYCGAFRSTSTISATSIRPASTIVTCANLPQLCDEIS